MPVSPEHRRRNGREEPLNHMQMPKMGLPRIPFTPEQASTVSGQVDALYGYLILITLFFSVLVTVLIFYFAIKYRRRSPDEVPRPIAGSLVLESLWTVIPFVIAMSIFAWGASLYFTLYRPPQNALDVYVVGKQWMWKFQHGEGQREINELHVPVGAKVKLTMTTEDVIHSFFVPAFRIRADVVPGKYTMAWFEATKTGRFHLFCTEYCGTNHSGMGGYVEVMEPAAYQSWLSGGGSESAAAQGAKTFQTRGCATCHKLEGPQGRGPMLAGIFGKSQLMSDGQEVVADEAYIRESILNPQAKTVAGFQQIMPTYQGQLSESDLLGLIAYIRSLGTPPAAGGGATGAADGTAATNSGRTGQEGTTTRDGLRPDAQRSNPIGATAPSAPTTGTGGDGIVTPGNASRGGLNNNRP